MTITTLREPLTTFFNQLNTFQFKVNGGRIEPNGGFALSKACLDIDNACRDLHWHIKQVVMDEEAALKFYDGCVGWTAFSTIVHGVIAALLRVDVRAIENLSINWVVHFPVMPKSWPEPLNNAGIIAFVAESLRKGPLAIWSAPRQPLRLDCKEDGWWLHVDAGSKQASVNIGTSFPSIVTSVLNAVRS